MQNTNGETSDGGNDPPEAPQVSKVLERNISALLHHQAEEEQQLGLDDRIADAITRFAGSMTFIYLHAAIFGLWILINVRLIPIVPAWDPSLVVLAMAASVEAIFLSTFILISQNRMAAKDEKRADLSLQISLLNEHETTQLVAMVAAIADKIGAKSEVGPEEIDEMKQNVPPEQVLEALERKSGGFRNET